MFGKLAGSALLILAVLFFVNRTMEHEAGIVVGDDRLEVRPGGWIWFAIKPSRLVSENESVEIQLDIRHLSGGNAQVLIVDKENFAKAEKSLCWAMDITAISSTVCIPDYEGISPELTFVDFKGAKTTDWINVGHPTVLYLLVTNINNDKFLQIEVEAQYRQRASDNNK